LDKEALKRVGILMLEEADKQRKKQSTVNHLSAIKTERGLQLKITTRTTQSKRFNSKKLLQNSLKKMGIVAFQWGEGENTLTLLQNRDNWDSWQVSFIQPWFNFVHCFVDE